jgi:hypothetical protein
MADTDTWMTLEKCQEYERRKRELAEQEASATAAEEDAA